MIRYLLAPNYKPFADSLGVATTLTADAPPVAGLQARAQAAVAITFDDGPHPEGTPRILEILAEQKALATFFVVGEQVEKRPQLLRQMLDEGHGIALHGYRHRLHLRRTTKAMEDDFTRGLAAIEDAAGIKPTRHRPPYGIYSQASLQIARERGLEPLLWATWGKDWRRLTTSRRIARRAVAGLRAGDVILLHDADFYSAKRSHERTAAALPQVLATLESARLATVLAV